LLASREAAALAENGHLSLERVTDLPVRRWSPESCPLCAAGIAFDDAEAFVIAPLDPASPAAAALLTALDAHQTALYPPDSCHLLPSDVFVRAGAAFFGAFAGGEAVGCCGLVTHADGTGEPKRLFVRPDCRGRGVARRLLAAVEGHARAAGVTVLRVETGVRQPASVAACEKSGYVRRGPFGGYPDDPLSVFLEKRLDAPPAGG
jgi:putative acetyltransferase